MADEIEEPSAPRSQTPAQTPEEPVAVSAYSSTSDPYGEELAQQSAATQTVETTETVPAVTAPPPKSPPPAPPASKEEEEPDEEEEGMLRMSFMEHLGELRARILKALAGIVVAFLVSITFCKPLWEFVSSPAVEALKHLGINPPNLAQITPMENFNVIYIKLPLLVSIFLASPWVLYQVWAFISPGLYKREKKWAVPFIVCTAGLFIAGGSFAYFVAFRFGLEFLLGIGRDVHVTPVVSINEYFDLFVNVVLGVGLVFEMPVIIFFLTLLHLASPRFLLRNSRYAILAITVLAAIVTPTPDVFNMMLFCVPMVLLFFVGVFGSYLLVLKREGRKFPWKVAFLVISLVIVIAAGVLALMVYGLHYHVINKWPFLVK
ncbi:MAG TPA: twin-arginine translocase subunit TatC [Bryobacteraceae bacterium]